MVKSFAPIPRVASLQMVAIFYTIMLRNYQRFFFSSKIGCTPSRAPGAAMSCGMDVSDYGKI
jgi:hypothetical protein